MNAERCTTCAHPRNVPASTRLLTNDFTDVSIARSQTLQLL